MMKHYIGNGAESYLYWNPVLEPTGRSTWGDPQNAMVTIDPASRSYTLNPDYYVMKSVSAIVQRGAVRLGMKGAWAADTLAFQNPDNSLALSVFNPFLTERAMTLRPWRRNAAFCAGTALRQQYFDSITAINQATRSTLMQAKASYTNYVQGQITQSAADCRITADTGAQERDVVNIYPKITNQQIEGFGGAMTESVGHTLSMMPADCQKAILSAVFGSDGLHYTIVRTSIDSCGFRAVAI